jgi:hypothetical protein
MTPYQNYERLHHNQIWWQERWGWLISLGVEMIIEDDGYKAATKTMNDSTIL